MANSSTDIFTATAKTISPCLLVFNTGGSVETVKAHLYDGTTSRQHAQVDVQPLGYAEIFFRATLEISDKVKGQSTSATTVNFWFSYVEITA